MILRQALDRSFSALFIHQIVEDILLRSHLSAPNSVENGIGCIGCPRRPAFRRGYPFFLFGGHQ